MAAFLEVEFTVTLMRLTELGYVESGDRAFPYYFVAPDAWANLPDETLQTYAFGVAERIYEEIGRAFKIAEPGDPNYIKVLRTRARVLGADEVAARPWLTADRPIWDARTSIAVNADGSYTRLAPADLADSAPAERNHVRIDRVLPALCAKQLPTCSAVYAQLYEQFHDPRPLDEQARAVWGAAVLFFCVLDRLASGGEYADPMATVEEMITWLAEGGEVPRETVENARQIYRKLFEYNVYRPNDTLFQMVYERAWYVRYSEYDPATPSAFQGFIHCLTGCRDALYNFDFDDPRRAAAPVAAAPPRSVVYEKIDAFTRGVVLPAFEEIRATLERHGKRVIISEDEQFGDEMLEGFFHFMHPTRRYARELATSPADEAEVAAGRAQYLGYSLVAVDPEQYESRFAGKFFETIMLTVGPNDAVYAAPFLMYHMKFDNKLHGFAHRFDNNREHVDVESIDKYMIQNHFLGAYDFFKIHARSDERPW
jgi:hypothetical protein